jgi:hypothetical protein
VVEDPVLVAPRCQSAEGARNLKRVGSDSERDLRVDVGRRTARVGSNLTVGRKVKRGERIFYQGIFSRTGRENLKAPPQGKRVEGVLNRIKHYRRVEETLKI